jgi:hypothetical protein
MRSVGAGRRLDPWRVRIRVGGGRLRGAGVLLTERHVLTCAHVVQGPHGNDPEPRIEVEFVGQPGVALRSAHVVEGCWVPSFDDDRGDVAVLELDQPAHGVPCASLRQLSLRGRVVRVQGFPRDLDDGVWAAAMVVGPGGPGGEWVQMDAVSQTGIRVQSGFSGAGVTDEKTGTVIGIVVSEYTDRPSGVSWMLPVETIAGHLPLVARYLTGGAAADTVFRDLADPRIAEVTDHGAPPAHGPAVDRMGAVRTVVGWLGLDGPGGSWNVVGDSSERSAVLGTVVALSDPALRPSLPDEFVATMPPGAVLPMGSIDVAVDATGRTAEQVAARIAERIGMRVDRQVGVAGQLCHEPPPMTVLIDSVDDAADPDSLLAELLVPLAGRAGEYGVRLVVGSRRPLVIGPSTVTFAVGDRARRSVPERLAGLAAAVEEVDATQTVTRRRRAYVAARVSGTPGVVDTASGLWVQLTKLQADGRSGERRFLAALAATERATAAALQAQQDTLRELDELLARRDELRRRLDVYRAMAVNTGRIEDIGLAELYRAAHDLLWRGPCDLEAAGKAVTRYVCAVKVTP